MDEQIGNKLIAKNTLMLYLRMLVVMIIGLYSSRLILKSLGINDYGIYNLVGGFVAMLSYLNTVFVGSTQRFLVFSLGKFDKKRILTTFQTACTVHVALSVFLLLVAETFGIWFVNNKLVIDSCRINAANWVYQCSVFSLFLTIVTVPYKSCVIAHEKMHIYAYASIADAILKLGIIFLLDFLAADKLKIYAVLHLLVTFVIPVWFVAYCKKNFEECKFRLGGDSTLLKEMGSYAGWMLVGNLGFSFKDQFSNIIMNHFLGTAINASRGIAAQVNSVVVAFADNFTIAMNPQITKQYASDNIIKSQMLVYVGARFSFFMLSLIVIPLILNIDTVLELWLYEVPEYTAGFLIITLVSSLFYSMSKTSSIAIQATGDIKSFQIGVAIIMLSELPLTWYFLFCQMPPYVSLMPMIITNLIGLFYRFIILKRHIPSYSWKYFTKEIVLKCSVLMSFSFAVSYFINFFLNDNVYGLIISSITSIIISVGIIYFFGLSIYEKTMILSFVKNTMKRRQ